ncbi:MAG TPA: aminotransferase class I/II-fold pyridoxal phosphate-dependent enzyme [Candidatus Acidoferrales bacterium]|jgi:histidinol-phosphate/aromatic aminotransferase/cobyric acid decarboxylase-like protein|nr:aminotransferase class I/II-fold pyridoxal phosphate-dependent enzyme [Candidatus Acidoferrales bacterium]
MKPPVPIRAAVEKMRAYNPPLEGRTKKIRLDFNENPIGCSPKVRQALAKLSAAEICSYPEQETVRRQMAKHFGVRPDELLLTNGTDEALHVIVSTFVEPDDSVLIVEPTYAMYRFYSELAGARVLAPRYDAGMEFPWDEVRSILGAASPMERGSAVRSGGLQPAIASTATAAAPEQSLLGGRSFSSDNKTCAKRNTARGEVSASNQVPPPRVFFLPNPNSPTGNLLSPTEIGHILDMANQTMVVIDEAYFEFSGVTVIPWIRRLDNLIVTRTFSKTAGLAGLRLGCIFVNRDLAAGMRKSQSPYPVNCAALVAAEAAMRDRAFIARTVREVKAGRAQLEKGLARLGIRYFPSGGNFILVYFGDRAKKIVSALDRKGILLRDRSSDFSGEGYVRITIGTPAQIARLLRFLEALL